MRRLGQEKAGITSRIKLDQVLIELKEKGVLQGGEPGVAQSFLKFRNDSLHADWNSVTESQVSSCLGLLDSLITNRWPGLSSLFYSRGPSKLRLGGDFPRRSAYACRGRTINFPTLTSKSTTLGWGTRL
jgi:hypothetical protein